MNNETVNKLYNLYLPIKISSSMIEDASNLISKRSLHWDLSGVYPGLVMRVGPTLANGVLEFVMDPRIKDRAYQHQSHGELSTGKN